MSDEAVPDWAQDNDQIDPGSVQQETTPDWAQEPAPQPQSAQTSQTANAEPVPDWAAAPAREQPAPGDEWSAPGAFAAGVARGAVPTTSGLAAGLAAGAAATPFTTPIGGIAVGLGVGALTSWMAGMGQDKLLAEIGRAHV